MSNETLEPKKIAEKVSLTAEESRRLAALGASADGKRVRALLGDENRLKNAIETGDTATLKNAMETVLRTEEGKRLFEQLGSLMGKR